jgi:hypothetical protein
MNVSSLWFYFSAPLHFDGWCCRFNSRCDTRTRTPPAGCYGTQQANKHQAVSGTPAFLETRRLIRTNDVNVFCTVLLLLLLILFLILLIFSTHFLFLHTLHSLHFLPLSTHLGLPTYIPVPTSLPFSTSPRPHPRYFFFPASLPIFCFLHLPFSFLFFLAYSSSSSYICSAFNISTSSSVFPSFYLPLQSSVSGAVTPTPSWILTCCWTGEHVTAIPCATLSSSGPLLLIPNVSLKLSDTWPSFFL